MRKSPEIEKYQNKENYGFSTKVERFSDLNKLNTPGPGTYDDKNILLAKSIEEKCYNNKEIIYKINKGRHSVYSVNRFDRQFPWNSEVINLKNKKNKKMKKNKSEDMRKKVKIFKNISQENNSSIIISKNTKKKDKILSGDGKEKTEEEILKEEETNILNEIKHCNVSDNMKAKLISINTIKNELEKIKNVEEKDKNKSLIDGSQSEGTKDEETNKIEVESEDKLQQLDELKKYFEQLLPKEVKETSEQQEKQNVNTGLNKDIQAGKLNKIKSSINEKMNKNYTNEIELKINIDTNKKRKKMKKIILKKIKIKSNLIIITIIMQIMPLMKKIKIIEVLIKMGL